MLPFVTINARMSGQTMKVAGEIGRRRLAEFVSALGGLLAFAGPALPYPTVTAEELNAQAWAQTGASLRGAIASFDGQYRAQHPERPDTDVFSHG